MAINIAIPDRLFKRLLAIGFALISFPVLSWWQSAATPTRPLLQDSIVDAAGYKPGKSANQRTEFTQPVVYGLRGKYMGQDSTIADRRIARWRAAVEAQRKSIEHFVHADVAGGSTSDPVSAAGKGSANAAVAQNLKLNGAPRYLMIQRMVQAQRKVAAQGFGLLP